MSGYVEAYRDLAVACARRQPGEENLDEKAHQAKVDRRLASLRRGLVIAAVMGVSFDFGDKVFKVHSTSCKKYDVMQYGQRWDCGCEYNAVVPRFDFGAAGTGRLCKHVAAAILNALYTGPDDRPDGILHAFERLVASQAPTLMSANVSTLKEWTLYKRVRVNIDDRGCLRLRVVKGRSSRPLARVWPVSEWSGSGPAPYECYLLDGHEQAYGEWLEEMRQKELVA